MKLKKILSMVITFMFVASCICVNAGAIEETEQGGVPITVRASGKFEVEVPEDTLVRASTSFPLEAGEQVTIKATYSPFYAEVDFGLISSDGIYHFLSVDDGSFDQTITISERGEYTLAVRNNSSEIISVSGYVNY